MNYEELAEFLLPGKYPTREELERRYPLRDLPKGAEVTRLAPSPTGFIHLGNLFVAVANERIAHGTGGKVFLRIEDTDLKRKVDGAVEAVIEALKYFSVTFDEGAEIEGDETYGPFYQRRRAEIYRAYAKELIREGRAYPCFCTEDELSALREEQKANKELTGYYGKYARCRNLSLEEIKENLKEKKPFVLRLRSLGCAEHKIKFHDEIKGDITLSENDQDIVILKSDGIPTYHFAHVIDDHLMRTTLVLRGEEWLASLPIHLELFSALKFERPFKYGHNCSIMKREGERKRKLSKRKDPEFSLSFYRKEGYYPRAVIVYMLTLLNSNFEEWYQKNPSAPLTSFPFSAKKMSASGTLFDLAKLNDICKTELSRLSEEEMADFLQNWAMEFGSEEQKKYFEDREYLLKVLRLCMGTESKKRRKDFETASQAMRLISYFFERPLRRDEYRMETPLRKEILEDFLKTYDEKDDSSLWFSKIKEIAAKHGFAAEMKAYKEHPENFKGNVSDVAEVLRIATTGRANTPDLTTIMQILGRNEVEERIRLAIEE